VALVQLVRRVFQDRAVLALQVLQEHRVLQDHKVFLVQRHLWEVLVLLVLLAPKVLQDKVQQVLLEK
jgi:hypothetical protein